MAVVEKGGNMEKVIKDGKVAICYSVGFGAGWYSWGVPEELVFHPKIVEMILSHRQSEIDGEWLVANFGEEYSDIYCGGADGLSIEWLPVGTMFRIDEYDGAESVVVYSPDDYLTA